MSSGPPQPGMYQPRPGIPSQTPPGMQRPPQPDGFPGAKPDQQMPGQGFPGSQFQNGHQQYNQMPNQMNQMNIHGDQPAASSQFPPSQPGMPPQMNQRPSHPGMQPPGQMRPPVTQPGMTQQPRMTQQPAPPNRPNQNLQQNRYPPTPMTAQAGGQAPPGNMPPQGMVGPTPPTSIGGPGMRPTNMGGPGMPPSSTGGHGMPHMDPRMPANSLGAPNMPPHSMAGSGSGIPPMGMGGPGMPPRPGYPPSMSQPGMPPNSMAGMPPNSMGGMPPNSIAGMPPNSMGGMPPNSMGGMPPNSMGGMPPVSMGGMPPTSMGGMPPTSMGGMPPVSMGGPGMPPGPGMPAHTVSGPGMPPQPGMPPIPQPGMPMGGTMPGAQYPPQPSQQIPGPRRLDPDQMPSAIQVIGDDMKTRSGVFNTGGRGLVPPLVTTDFTCQDQGNCNPRFLRSTMYNVPVNNDMMKQCNMPFGLVCSPYAQVASSEAPPPLVDLGEMGPVRCKRCRAYMCPFMQFIDGGRRFSCPFCNCATDVPEQYFQHLDHTGKRVDTFERPELCLGSYEFAATKDYCKNGVLPKPPAFIFMIDVSYNSVKSGLVHLICQHIKDEILPNLPREPGQQESDMRVGFVTYSNILHFYNVKGTLVQPQMMVVGDVDDVFVPMVEGFLVKPSEADSVIDSLLQMLPAMFSDARETDTILGPVIQAGLDALRSAGCPGKLFIFHTSLPIAEAPGKLKNRDDRKLLGTDKEKMLFEPQTPFYTTLGQDCVAHGCGVDLFLFPNSYIDVATISQVCKLSGGDVYKYDYFTTDEGEDVKADSHGTQFINDLRGAVGKQIAFDVIVRCRTSTGLRPVGFHGNFNMVNTTDVELSVLDCDKAFCIDVKHDDKLNESDGAFIQIAMLFTSVTGQRRLRIHNLSLNVCNQMADMFKSADLDTLVNFLSKRAVTEQLTKSPKDVREMIASQCSDILVCYRRNCATNSSHGQLILPETMKLLPLYSNCVLKNDALQAGQEVSTDTRSTLLHQVNGMDVKTSVPFFYPRLLPVHNLDPDSIELPMPVRCSYERLQEHGAYILENGFFLYLWLGHALNPDFIQNVFGVASLAQINVEHPTVIEMSNPVSKRVHGIIKTIREQRGRYMKLLIVRQRDKMEPWFNHYLVEDKGVTGSPSYVDYLLHIHKEIRGK